MKTFPASVAVLVLVLLGVAFGTIAQKKGEIRGVVKDAVTKVGIPLATVVLIDTNTHATVKGVQTGDSGAFVIADVPNGVFVVKVSYVGYQTMVRGSMVITPANDVVNLGELTMNTVRSNTLTAVTVAGRKPDLQTGFNKKTFSVNQSLVSEGGSAADLLQNVPTLQLDVHGNVSLRGSTDVKVLIDGKPSLIAGGNLVQILQSLPASSIEKVELITNPSARYDAEGQNIINIVLKRNHKAGFNGSAAVTGGTRENYNASTSLSYQNSRVNLYGNYSYRYGNTYSNGFQNITYLNGAAITGFSNETFPSLTLNKGHTVKAGVDYYLAEKSWLSFSGGFNSRDTHRDEFLSIDNLNADHSPGQLSHRDNTIHGDGSSYDLSLDFNQQFKKPKEELTINFSYAHGWNNGFQVYDTHVYDIDGQAVTPEADILQNNSFGRNTNYNIQADYTLPVGKTGKLEAGYRSQIGLTSIHQAVFNLNDTTGKYDPNYLYSNFFSSNNQVHALYLSYGSQIRNFSYQIGLRGEDAILRATLADYDTNHVLVNTPVKVTNKGLYPSVFLTQKFAGNQQLQVSYTRRVTRPTAREINPFLDISDPVNFDTGNPALLPEDIHSVELGYSKSWKGVALTSSIYYNQVNNVIKHIESQPVDGVITTFPQNIKRSTNTGLELIGRLDLSKVWGFTANVNVYYRQNDAAPPFGITATSGYSCNANITNNFNLARGLSVQVRADYRANDVLIQDRNHAAFGLDAGAKYDFAGGKASLSFSSRDIFNSRKWSFLRESNTTLLDFERRTLGSRASLSFTYRLGKGANGRPKKVKKSEEKKEKRIDEES